MYGNVRWSEVIYGGTPGNSFFISPEIMSSLYALIFGDIGEVNNTMIWLVTSTIVLKVDTNTYIPPPTSTLNILNVDKGDLMGPEPSSTSSS